MSFVHRYGPWAVIAGASEGTGRAFAHQIAGQGVSCILIARREAPLNALAEEIRIRHGVECVAASIDLSAADAADRIDAAVAGRPVGLLVCNAGGDGNSAHFLDQRIDAWVDLASRNVMTVMRCCHRFGGLMRDRGRGGLLLVGSGACYGGASFMAVYSATKAFDLCFSEGLWAELRPYGVDVLGLILGRTDTPAFRATLAKRGLPVPANLASPEEVARIGLERLPHGPVHNWGQADEAAGYLSSSAAVRRNRVLALDEMTKDVFGPR
ncbi:MAG TPA: SDR family NAD(P)-dependent oxidoreductase [Steroidobacteraceae bacterium]|nr:SDR family NAD(P)-dependent oxidoreductase [Steroidobacteraceae bacterium]